MLFTCFYFLHFNFRIYIIQLGCFTRFRFILFATQKIRSMITILWNLRVVLKRTLLNSSVITNNTVNGIKLKAVTWLMIFVLFIRIVRLKNIMLACNNSRPFRRLGDNSPFIVRNAKTKRYTSWHRATIVGSSFARSQHISFRIWKITEQPKRSNHVVSEICNTTTDEHELTNACDFCTVTVNILWVISAKTSRADAQRALGSWSVSDAEKDRSTRRICTSALVNNCLISYVLE